MTVILTEEAEADLRGIVEHIELDNPAAARAVYDEILECLRYLDQFPEMWPRVLPRSPIRKRSVSSYPYLIYYTVRQTNIVVLRVYDGRRRPLPFGNRTP